MLSGLTMVDTPYLAEGEVPVRTYWATCQHYGYKEAVTREEAEAYALEHPTNIETLSYAERDAGVIPAGKGTVELRIVTKHEGGGIDTAILRYEVLRKRGGGRA